MDQESSQFNWIKLIKRMSPAPFAPFVVWVVNCLSINQVKIPWEYGIWAFLCWSLLVALFYIYEIQNTLTMTSKGLQDISEKHSALSTQFDEKSKLLDKREIDCNNLCHLAQELVYTSTQKDRQSKIDLFLRFREVNHNE